MNRRRITKVRPLSVSLNRFSSALGVAAALAAGAGAAKAAQTWVGGPTIGVDNLWNTATSWTTAVPNATDVVTFNQTSPAYSPSNFITLGAGELANSLLFKVAPFTNAPLSPYTLTSGDLTLTTGSVSVDGGVRAVINSQLNGTAGLTKTGCGVLVLGNAANGYTGTTLVSGGTLQISSNGALGASTTTVSVTGNSSRGTMGGQLFLAGGSGGSQPATPFTLSRPLNIVGEGLASDAAALVTMGDNTVSGGVTIANTAVTRIQSTLGTTTFNGNFVLPATQANNTLLVPSIGHMDFSGATVSGGFLVKQGNGTVIFGPTNTYTGTTQVDAGFLRVSSGTSLGTSTAANAIQMNGGTLEIRGTTPTFANKRIQLNANSTLFADHPIGSTVMNQTASFADFNLGAVNRVVTFNGRDGYGMSFTPLTAGTTIFNASGANGSTVNNNLNGLLTIAGNIWGNTDATGSRTFVLGGNGDTLITGSILGASTSGHNFTKNGVGTLTVGGVASTYSGATNINAGTLSIANFGSTGTGTGAASAINLGTTTVAGGLRYTGAGETVAKTININGTTGPAILDASGTGALIIPNITVDGGATPTAGGAKILWLTGNSGALNEISGVIADSTTGATNLNKTGAGTWVLSGNNTFGPGIGVINPSVNIFSGTLQLKATNAASNILNDTLSVTFSSETTVNNRAGGTLQYLGAAGGSTETLARLVATDGSSTVQLDRSSGPTELIFAGTSAPSHAVGATLNFVINNPGVNGTDSAIRATTQVAGGFMNGGFYFGNTDFAAYNGSGSTGFVRALIYGTDLLAAAPDTAGLAGGSHNKITLSQAGIGPVSVLTLNLSGSGTSLGLSSGALTLTSGTRGIIKAGGGAPSSISGEPILSLSEN